MADLFKTPMDSRTIAMILKDEETLQLARKASDELLKSNAQRDLEKFFIVQSTHKSPALEIPTEEQYPQALYEITEFHLNTIQKAKAEYERALHFANSRTREQFESSFKLKLESAEKIFNLEVEKLNQTFKKTSSQITNEKKLSLIYKQGSFEEISLNASKCPVTPKDFYELAIAIQHNDPTIEIFYLGKSATKQIINRFACNLLNDAARADYLPAKNALITATMQGDREARQFTELKDHVIGGMLIKLPRKLTTYEEIRKLGSDLLIQHRKKNYEPGRPLYGDYYVIPNGELVGQLAKSLLTLAEKMRIAEMEEKSKRIGVSEQSLGDNGLFSKSQNRTLFEDTKVKEYNAFSKAN